MTATRWQRARQIVQVASAALFFSLAFFTYRGSVSLVPLDLYLRVDPLAALAAMLAARAVIAALLLGIVALALGLIFGRAWCGWLCPLGALLDWITPRAGKAGRIEPGRQTGQGRHIGLPLYSAKYVLLLVIVFSALLGNLSLMILDPITLLVRTFGSAFLPALNVVVVGIETVLYPMAPPLQPLLDWIEQSFRGTLLPAQQTFYQLGWMFALVFVGVMGLNWVAPRFWCRYLCPLGALYAWLAKCAWLRPRATNDCSHCAACLRACPTGAIAVTKQGFSVDPAECVMCMDCAAACPESVISIRLDIPDFLRRDVLARHSTFDPSRRHFVASALASLGAVALFRAAPSARRDDPFLVRPPGARENDFLSKCIRCGECSKVCPTGVLQPSLFQAGLEGFWTPILTTRLGYCDYACNACGQICPTGAIPPLSLEEKRQRVIGTAYIDQNRCIPWASYRPCIVCEEMCPVPQKAIRLDEVDVVAPNGQTVHLQRPRVLSDLCIGCGICEYQCPLVGPAAIRVYAPMRLPPLG